MVVAQNYAKTFQFLQQLSHLGSSSASPIANQKFDCSSGDGSQSQIAGVDLFQ
jgi:hypothetical protein